MGGEIIGGVGKVRDGIDGEGGGGGMELGDWGKMWDKSIWGCRGVGGRRGLKVY